MHNKFFLDPRGEKLSEQLAVQFARVRKMVEQQLSWLGPQALPRIAPFLVYMLGLALSDTLDLIGEHAWDLRWLYVLRVVLVALVLLAYREKYVELQSFDAIRVNDWAMAVGAGCAVFVLWVNLDFGWLAGQPGFNPTVDGAISLPLAAARWIGATLIVPLMEELFWRSFLLRWLEQREFITLDPARVGLQSIAWVTVLFGFEHNLWVAGMVAGLAYNMVYIRSKNLWLPVVAHAVTNGLLGLWVVAGSHWEFW